MLGVILTPLLLTLLLATPSVTPLSHRLPSESPPKSLHPLSLTIEQLGDQLGGIGRAKSLWTCLRSGVDPFDASGGVVSARTLCQLGDLLQGTSLVTAQLESETESPCGGRKLLLRLSDGQSVESVLIPSLPGDRTTLCVSSQLGCDRGCSFCLTSTMGLIRNLTSDEILSQVFIGLSLVRKYSLPKLTNVVFMGMGDAGRNLQEVGLTVQGLTDKFRYSMAQNRITVSTVGPHPEVFPLLARCPCNIAWSLHSPDNEIRRRLVPSSRHSTESLRESIVQALLSRESLSARSLMVAFTLIEGVNDSLEDARKISEFMKPLRAVCSKLALDLIPYNDVNLSGYSRPSEERVIAFQNFLRKEGYFCMRRLTRGDSESAACGMLATKRIKSSLTLG